MASGVSRATIAPRLSTKPVNPLLDWSCSSDLSLPKSDSRTSVDPGNHSPGRHLRRLRGDELDQLLPQLAGPPLGGRQGRVQVEPGLRIQAQVPHRLQGHSDQVVPRRPFRQCARGSPPASPAWRARDPAEIPARASRAGSSSTASVATAQSTNSARFMKRHFDRWLGGTSAANSVCCMAPFAAAAAAAKRFHSGSCSSRAFSRQAALCLMS